MSNVAPPPSNQRGNRRVKQRNSGGNAPSRQAQASLASNESGNTSGKKRKPESTIPSRQVRARPALTYEEGTAPVAEAQPIRKNLSRAESLKVASQKNNTERKKKLFKRKQEEKIRKEKERNKETSSLEAIPLMDMFTKKGKKRKREENKNIIEYSLKRKREKTSGYVCLTCGIKFHLQVDLAKHIHYEHADITKPFKSYRINKDKRKVIEYKRGSEKRKEEIKQLKNRGKKVPLIEYKTKQRLNFGTK